MKVSDRRQRVTPTLLDALERAARTDRGIDFAVGRGALERRSYADFARAVARAAGGFASAGIRGPVLLIMPNGEELLATFFGALSFGAIPAILPTPRPFGDPAAWVAGLAATSRHADDAPIITTPAIARLFEDQPDAARLRVLLVADVLRGVAREPSPRGADETALLQFTSGSLGTPKGVMLSHRALSADARAIAERTAAAPGDVGVFWVPLAHDMALLSFAMMLEAGIDQIVMSPERFAVDPAGWLELVAARGTMTVGPPFAFGLALDRLLRKGVRPDFSRLRGVVVGAEPIDAGVLRRFVSTLAPAGLRDRLFMPSYGLAEMTCVGCLGAAGQPLVTTTLEIGGRPCELVGHGPPLRDHAVRIVREDGSVATEGELGRVQLSGPAAMQGYWRSPEATAAAFDDGWVVTGDLGFVQRTEQGDMVFVAGREKDVIIVRGRHFFPDELEAVATMCLGVRPRGALAFGEMDPGGGVERVTLCLELEPDVEEADVAGLVKRAIADQFDLSLAAVIAVPTGSLPRTTSGKLRRGEARRRWGTTQP